MSTWPNYDFRIGIDLGGTKTEIAALSRDGRLLHRHRVPTPHLYEDSVRGMAGMIREIEQKMAGVGSVGFGIPGVISPVTGLVKNEYDCAERASVRQGYRRAVGARGES